MFLAHALAIGRAELMCDLAEIYHIYDYKQLPPKTVAVFSYGLRENSRLKMKIAGSRCTTEQMILSMIYDRVNWLRWAMSAASKDPDTCPEMLTPKLLGMEVQKESSKNILAFEDGSEFERSRKMIIGGEVNG
jgi:hypothetical protein